MRYRGCPFLSALRDSFCLPFASFFSGSPEALDFAGRPIYRHSDFPVRWANRWFFGGAHVADSGPRDDSPLTSAAHASSRHILTATWWSSGDRRLAPSLIAGRNLF